MTIVSSVSPPTRIAPDLKSELEKIAQFEDRSTSYMANQAIRNFVEEHRATRELLRVGMSMVEQGAPSIPPKDVHEWFVADDERPFPLGS